jgi:NDP-sugar pyrophosphorylase family protein
VVNADAWARRDLPAFVAGWDGAGVRMLVAGSATFGPRSAVVASLLPWSQLARLRAEPSGLWEVCWRDLAAAGAVETVTYDGPFVDCGTPARYLAANRWAAALAPDPGTTGPGAPRPAPGDPVEAAIVAAGAGSVVHPSAVLLPGASVTSSVVGPGATVAGEVRDSVIWSGSSVHRGEALVGAVRAGSHLTVLVR